MRNVISLNLVSSVSVCFNELHVTALTCLLLVSFYYSIDYIFRLSVSMKIMLLQSYLKNVDVLFCLRPQKVFVQPHPTGTDKVHKTS